MLLNVRLMAFFMRHNSSLVCMVRITCVCIETIFMFYGYFFFSYPSLLLSRMFEHDCLDACCFGYLICKCFIFLYLHLFSATENASHGEAL